MTLPLLYRRGDRILEAETRRRLRDIVVDKRDSICVNISENVFRTLQREILEILIMFIMLTRTVVRGDVFTVTASVEIFSSCNSFPHHQRE